MNSCTYTIGNHLGSLIWFLARLPRGEKRAERIFVALWWAIPYVFFSVVRTKMSAYVLVAAPALFIMIGLLPVIPVFAFRAFMAATGQAEKVLIFKIKY